MGSKNRRADFSRRLGFWLVSWVLLCILWFLYIDQVNWPEILASMLAAGIAALLWESLRVAGLLRFPPSLSWFRGLWLLPGWAVRDTGKVFLALFRLLFARQPFQGAIQEVPFGWVGDEGRDEAQRAFLTAAMSFAPNTYVIGIDREKRVMVVHQLVPTAPRQTAEQLSRL
jgi:multisubunit Na+/H+ antiporter MnhE subunit